MKLILTPIYILTLTLVALPGAHADDMTVDNADSLNFNNFHKNDEIKLINSNKPTQSIVIAGNKKTRSNSNDKHTVSVRYSLNNIDNEVLSSHALAEKAVQNAAVRQCSNGWREQDQWLQKDSDVITLSYQFSCR